MSVQTPDWVKHALFYQIFPDRFARSPRLQHVAGIRFKAWGSPPEEQGFQGGDLLGIVDKLDYLQELGITALYLNPVFASAANHRYHTFDYFQVDPLLGGESALRELVDEVHARGMHIVLDGVFNHAGRGFWAFHHILETGKNSPYLDWFLIHDWPLHPYDNGDGKPANYEAWWGNPALPKFNFKNPGVRDYFLQVAKHWIDFGIDGWRLDVPEEIDDEAFWQDFRRVVKEANPDAYIVGEIWHEAQEWLRGDRFDAVMNYVFNRAAFGFFAAQTLRTDYEPGGYRLQSLNVSEFAMACERMTSLYDPQVVFAQLNLLDSHDTARTPWIVGGDESAQRLCILFQMTMPGAPCIYYGDEIGMTGASDPYCRGAFPWDDRTHWDHSLLHFHTRAIAMRHQHTVLRIGDFQTVFAEGQVYAFQRKLHDDLHNDVAIVILNAGYDEARITLRPKFQIENGTILRDVWNQSADQATISAQDGQLANIHVAARSAVVLIAELDKQ